jgi:DNA-directed RNA polymerase subunit RPC12/RpoP
MAIYGSVKCPECGLKMNVKESSVDTMKRCQGCGHKFVVMERPRGRSRGAVWLLILVIIAFVVWRINYGAR